MSCKPKRKTRWKHRVLTFYILKGDINYDSSWNKGGCNAK